MTISVEDLAQKLAAACGLVFSPVPKPVAVPAPAPSADGTAAPAAAPAPVAPVGPIQITNYAAKGYHLDVAVPADMVVAAAWMLDACGFALDAITGVDWIANGEMEVVYDYFHPLENCRVVVRARIPRATPQIATISKAFAGANWHERETHDFFGIEFTGHPDLTPLLLPEDATFHPLRKDFVA